MSAPPDESARVMSSLRGRTSRVRRRRGAAYERRGQESRTRTGSTAQACGEGASGQQPRGRRCGAAGLRGWGLGAGGWRLARAPEEGVPRQLALLRLEHLLQAGEGLQVARRRAAHVRLASELRRASSTAPNRHVGAPAAARARTAGQARGVGGWAFGGNW